MEKKLTVSDRVELTPLGEMMNNGRKRNYKWWYAMRSNCKSERAGALFADAARRVPTCCNHQAFWCGRGTPRPYLLQLLDL